MTDDKTTVFTRINKAFRSDAGFMGVTHALSILAVSLILIAFLPDFVTNVLKTSDMATLALFVITAIGAGNLPDLDNTASRAKSDLGPFGVALSVIFRATSTLAQTVIRTKRDDPTPNPHRGAWHTIPAAVLLGGLVFLGSQIKGNVSIPVVGNTTWGVVFAIFIAFVLTHLMLSTLAKKFMDKVKKSNAAGEIVAILISLVVAVGLVNAIPTGSSFWWLGVSIAFGMTLHVLGDCFTTAGAPIFFPITALVKGKFWWTTRFLSIKAGGPFEQYVFVPAFILISIIGAIKIAFNIFG